MKRRSTVPPAKGARRSVSHEHQTLTIKSLDVAAIVWIVATGFVGLSACVNAAPMTFDDPHNDGGVTMAELKAADFKAHWRLTLVGMFAPPAGLLLAGLNVVWVVKGFQRA
jgi:hypothetical protein